MGTWLMRFGTGADEGGGEAPSYANKEEAENIVEDWGTGDIVRGGSHGDLFGEDYVVEGDGLWEEEVIEVPKTKREASHDIYKCYDYSSSTSNRHATFLNRA